MRNGMRYPLLEDSECASWIVGTTYERELYELLTVGDVLQSHLCGIFSMLGEIAMHTIRPLHVPDVCLVASIVKIACRPALVQQRVSASRLTAPPNERSNPRRGYKLDIVLRELIIFSTTFDPQTVGLIWHCSRH